MSAERTLDIHRLGVLSYPQGLFLQERLVADVKTGNRPDTLLLLQHSPTITLGRASRAEHLLEDMDSLTSAGVDVFESPRGGDVTYHAPGQIVAYPILDLRHRQDLHAYMRDIEEVVIRTIACYGIEGGRRKGLTGVWTDFGKIAAIGIRAQGWITSHGFALNVNINLQGFEYIVPCGLHGQKVTSIQAITGSEQALEETEDRLILAFAEVFGYKNITEAGNPLSPLTNET